MCNNNPLNNLFNLENIYVLGFKMGKSNSNQRLIGSEMKYVKIKMGRKREPKPMELYPPFWYI